ncbi:4386_t:CDS:2, partial [Funneliformis geosporum]
GNIRNIHQFVNNISQSKGLNNYVRSGNIKKVSKELIMEFDSIMQVTHFSLMVDFGKHANQVNKKVKSDFLDLFQYFQAIAKGVTGVHQQTLDVIFQLNAINEKASQLMAQSKSTIINISESDELQNWIKDSTERELITEIKWNDLAGNSRVDSGHRGLVYKSHWKKMDNKEVACKRLILDEFDAIQHEIQILNRGHVCDNIIRFLGITQDPESKVYCIVMEYADGGDLRAYLKKKIQTLGWDQKGHLALGNQIINKYFLSIQKNILIHNGDAKITDFGNSKSIETQTKIHKDVFGMIPYVAPELFESNEQLAPYSIKTDIYHPN